MKDTKEKRLWSLTLWLKRAAKAMYVAGESLHRDPERPLYETMKMKPILLWRSQDLKMPELWDVYQEELHTVELAQGEEECCSQ